MIPTLSQKKRVIKLYRKCPKNSVEVCFNEFGPLELKPHHGYTWAQSGHPRRQLATYTWPNGVSHFFGFLDIHANHLWGYFQRRKRSRETLAMHQLLRKRYPAKTRIYLILDNFSPHRTKKGLKWLKNNNIKLIWTPTNTLWLNHI